MASKVFQDQMGYKVSIDFPPKKIVSLVPSHTELLFHLGLQDRICGVTKFCTHPKELMKGVPKVGGTKDFKVDHIIKLQPDLVIANKEENEKTGILALKEKLPVWMSDIHDVEEALDMIEKVATVTATPDEGNKLIKEISSGLEVPITPQPLSVLYFIWQKPYMVAAGNTYIDAVLEKTGFVNVAKHLKRYPVLSDEEIRQLNPDLIFLSSEPYPFKEKHKAAFQELAPSSKVVCVDGEIFSWYGARMRYIKGYVSELVESL
ncbi:helical backbone metal receptor [Cytophagaceae bacterium ABcell3]|nr:helical backbone metal receptor [Cytophagaceae bacterium ABcell3]